MNQSRQEQQLFATRLAALYAHIWPDASPAHVPVAARAVDCEHGQQAPDLAERAHLASQDAAEILRAKQVSTSRQSDPVTHRCQHNIAASADADTDVFNLFDNAEEPRHAVTPE